MRQAGFFCCPTNSVGGTLGSALRLTQRHLAACRADDSAPAPAHGHPPHDDAHAHPGEHPHPHHVHKANPMPLIVGILAAVVVAGIVGLAVVANRGSVPTFAELKAKLGVPAEYAGGRLKVSQVDFMNRLGTPHHVVDNPAQNLKVFYYPIQGGNAEITVELGGWEVGEARIVRITTR